MIKNMALAVVLFCAGSLIVDRPAQAWHGYPPFGAWAYGTGYAPAGFTRSRTVVRSRPTWTGWGAYGNLGYRSYGYRTATRVYSRSFYRPYMAYSAPVIAYPAYLYPVYSYPVFYSTYTYPAFVPTYAPTCATPTVFSFSAGYPLVSISSRSVTTSPLAALAANTATSAVLTATNTGAAQPALKTADASQVPGSLLEAADAILKAGGYEQAARAYAQLSVRFGTSETLLGRRFIAQVFAGDLEQAEAIVALADMTGLRLDRAGAGSLQQLVEAPVIVQAATEKLAQRALQDNSDSLRLKSVATWLQLTGDTQLASVFMSRVAQIDGPSSNIDSSPEVILPQQLELVAYE